MAINTAELLARICAIEEEATAAIGITSHAFNRWQIQSETVPYWRNNLQRIQLDTSTGADGQEVDTYRYSVASAFHLAEVTAGYDGEKDALLVTVLPQIIQYFDEREVLQSAAYPVGMAFLRLSYFEAADGYVNFPYSAAGGIHLGALFQWTCIFDRLIQQVY